MSQELLFVVDENDHPLSPRPRTEVIEKGLWRRTGAAMIIDKQKMKVLCQKRSEAKDERPGVWIAVFGGKSAPGEEPRQTVCRELREELGITIKTDEPGFYKKLKSDARKQFEYVYYVYWQGNKSQIQFDVEEVSEIAWLDIAETIDLLKNDPNWYSYGFETEMLQTAKKGSK